MTSARQRLVWRGVAVLSASALVLLLGSGAPPGFLDVEDPMEPADAAIVMTGDPGFERTKAASRLVLSGTARLLVLTGGEPWPGDSAASLRATALAQGVPPQRIRLEDRSSDTRESLLNIEPILRQERARVVILVTSPSHQRRAFLAARRALPGIRIINRPVRTEAWPPVSPWWRSGATRQVVVKEYSKLAYYALHGWI